MNWLFADLQQQDPPELCAASDVYDLNGSLRQITDN